jgi:hypothetical protein
MKYWVLLLYALAGANLTWARSQELPRAKQPLVFEPNRGQAPAEAILGIQAESAERVQMIDP